MILEHLNYIAVAVGAVIYFIIGGMWFSPMLFSKAWVAGHGIQMPSAKEAKEKMKKEMPMLFLKTFIIGFIMTIALACFVNVFNAHTWMVGAKIGLAASVFACGTILMTHLYTKKSMTTMMIDCGYHFVSLIIVGILLSVWR